jgi:hypothetical protein
MLIVANKPIMLNVIMLSVVMLTVNMLNVVAPPTQVKQSKGRLLALPTNIGLGWKSLKGPNALIIT